MPLAHKQPFISTGEFVARKNFTFDGVDYKVDEEFPHRDVGCEGRKLRNMFDAGFLKAAAGVEKPTKKAAKIVEEDDDDTDENTPVKNDSSRAEARKRRQLNRKLAKAKKK